MHIDNVDNVDNVDIIDLIFYSIGQCDYIGRNRYALYKLRSFLSTSPIEIDSPSIVNHQPTQV